MATRKLFLYLHTLRYLRPIQVANRLWRKLRWTGTPTPRRLSMRSAVGPWVAPIAAQSSMTSSTTFRFLNVEGRCAVAADWQARGATHLWLYNLHYFDDLNSEDASARSSVHATLVERWIRENPVGGGVGWEPYPTSRRIVNWIKWAMRGHALSA